MERLLLFHTADPVAVVRHHTAGLRPEGVVACIDFDVGGARTFPAVPLVTQVAGRLEAGFRHGGADPTVGARLAQILKATGLRDVGGFGVVAYLAPDDPSGPRFIAGVARSLLPVITAAGIATAEEVGSTRSRGGWRTRCARRTRSSCRPPSSAPGGPLDPRRLAAPPGLI